NSREANCAGVVIEIARLRFRLTSADCLLHLGREVLHPHRESGEAKRPQYPELFACRDSWVNFDRQLGVGLNVKVARHGSVQPLDLAYGQVSRSAAAPMMLDNPSPVSEPGREHLDLPLQVAQVAFGDLALLRDYGHASAVGTSLLAKGQVHVERQRFRR